MEPQEKPQEKSITVFFPAYNEEENIERLVGLAESVLNDLFDDYEIIIVDDGSTDETVGITKNLATRNSRIRIYKHPQNMGHGAAIKSGITTATKDLIFYTDADNQFDISEIKLALPLIEQYDIVCGYREKRQDPLTRLFISWFYNKMMRILYGVNIRDIDCSFKLFRRERIQPIANGLKSQTGFLETELIVKANKQGLRMKEVGVSHFPRTAGQTKYEFGRNRFIAFVKPSEIMEILKEMKKLWKEMR